MCKLFYLPSLWFDSICVAIVPSCVWACECFCFLKIELPWFFRCCCSTVSESHRIATATAVPCLTTPCICAFGASLTLPRAHRASVLGLMSPDFGSTKGNLCCKSIWRPNKCVCTDKLLMISSLISCCCFYNSNLCQWRGVFFFFFYFSILGFLEIKSISALDTWVEVCRFVRRVFIPFTLPDIHLCVLFHSLAEDCQADGTDSYVVPIAVGIALLVLILIVVLAYFIGRKRNMAAGYQSF